MQKLTRPENTDVNNTSSDMCVYGGGICQIRVSFHILFQPK